MAEPKGKAASQCVDGPKTRERIMQDMDKEPTKIEQITDLVATMKACGTYRDVKVVKMDDLYAELEAEWITTNYGNTPETLEKIRLTVKF